MKIMVNGRESSISRAKFQVH